ncbi:MAG: flagellar basal body L-ring protein FlgH [Acidovorax sp.]
MTAAIRLAAAIAGAAAALLAAGCASTLNPPPPVDVLPTTPPVLQPRANVAAGPATGSLFRPTAYRPPFEDRRARLVGDIVTINIIETVSASQKSTSNTEHKGSTAGGVTALPFITSGSTLGKLGIGATSENTYGGSGDTASTNTFTGSIAATVVEVLPNGYLVVTGEKQIGLNQNLDVLRFSGTVDPRALLPGSIISSTQVANVRIESRGKGQAAEAQAMGWLGRAFNSFTPF